jgi:hypothetical protein
MTPGTLDKLDFHGKSALGLFLGRARHVFAHRLDEQVQPVVVNGKLRGPLGAGDCWPDLYERAGELAAWDVSWPVLDQMPEKANTRAPTWRQAPYAVRSSGTATPAGALTTRRIEPRP